MFGYVYPWLHSSVQLYVPYSNCRNCVSACYSRVVRPRNGNGGNVDEMWNVDRVTEPMKRAAQAQALAAEVAASREEMHVDEAQNSEGWTGVQ